MRTRFLTSGRYSPRRRALTRELLAPIERSLHASNVARLGKLFCGAVFGGLAACAQIAGLNQYLASNDSDAGPMARREDGNGAATGMEGDGRAESGGDAFVEGPNGDDGFGEGSTESDAVADGSNEADVGNGDDADTGVSAMDGQSDGPETSTTYACLGGACNTLTHACQASGRCYCSSDRDCKSAKCVSRVGQNDLSCAAACTGSGSADGFGCEIVGCVSNHFRYTPNNFNPAAYSPPLNATTDCNATYNSTSHTFTAGSCVGQAPTIVPNVAQTSSGHADILVFKSLTITGTFLLVGGNPVILAVYGGVAVHGTIDASAKGATPGPGGNNCPSASNGSNTPDAIWESGGSGAGQAAAGGLGGASRNSAQGLAGVSQGTGPVPLTGGCAGGLPFTGANLNYSPADGAGGGGVQISAAGAVDLSSGTINVSGSGGGNGEPSKCTQPGSVPENGTGGAGGGSGGSILIEAASIIGGSLVATGGPGGVGGAAPPPTNKAGGAGGAGGNAGAPGMAGGQGVYTVDPTLCNPGGSWSGGGGGGGAGGYVKTVAHGCACTQDSDCSSALCSNVSGMCGAGACTGTTAAGTYDSLNCQYALTTNSTR